MPNTFLHLFYKKNKNHLGVRSRFIRPENEMESETRELFAQQKIWNGIISQDEMQLWTTDRLTFYFSK